MALIVQKFGGTSVGNLDRIQHVAKIIMQTRSQGHEVVVVVSAMSGETDRLINFAKAIAQQPDAREYAVLVTTGEQVVIALLAMALIEHGCPARSYTGAQAHIKTDHHHAKARILNIDCRPLRADLLSGRVPIVAGFQGITEEGDITALGRGGSDTTAVALAAALQADECQIYTDVDGIYTADPRLVTKAQRLEQITFVDMLELASQGSKVIQQRAVEFANKYQVPLRVLSSFAEGPGTLVSFAEKRLDQPVITGIASSRQETKITLRGLNPHPETLASILNCLANVQIDIDMLVQQLNSCGNIDVTFTVNRDDYLKVMASLHKQAESLNNFEVIGDNKVAKISLVGVGLRSHPAIMSTLFKTLAEINVPILLVSTSEIKIAILIADTDLERSVQALHTSYGLEEGIRTMETTLTLSNYK